MADDATSTQTVENATWPDDAAGYEDVRWRKGNRERRQQRGTPRPAAGENRSRVRRGPSRDARRGTETFKCRHCRTFVGPTVSGGRHRNHCPRCLYSRHVDDRRPGDRASDCGSLMAPVARFDRPNGEPVIVHRCLGCGIERHNRLAADDSILLLTWLPLVEARRRQRTGPRREEARRQVS